MYCKCSFIIYASNLNDKEIDDLINLIGQEPGITEDRLFYGMCKKKIDDNFHLSVFIYEAMSNVINKKDLFIKLKEKYDIYYELNVKITDTKGEDTIHLIENLNSELNEFIDETETFYNYQLS